MENITINELVARVAAGERIEDHAEMIERDHRAIMGFELSGATEEECAAYRALYAAASKVAKPRIQYAPVVDSDFYRGVQKRAGIYDE